jgi:tellurite resistance protein TerC
MLIVDLAVFHRKSREVKVKEALLWTGMWILFSLIFNSLIYKYLGKDKAMEFFTGYLIEKSLSIDNIFVFIIIFSSFNVPSQYQHKVLFWGIIGALVMRLIFIFSGIALINKFHWIIYIFAAFLIFTGVKIFFQKKKKINSNNNIIVRLFRKVFSVTNDFHGNKFFIRKNSRIFATPLFIVLIFIEVSDLIFAMDSIPAILAISVDEFIVYTSNAFAILGMRSLYFAIAGINRYFRYLRYGLSLILVFVGVKMALSDIYKLPTVAALIIIVLILSASVIVSVVIKPTKKELKKNPLK